MSDIASEMLAMQELARTEIPKAVARYYAEIESGWGYTPEQFEEPLAWLLEDHSDTTPERLAEMARALTPGGVHTGGFLINLVRNYMPLADRRLMAATIYSAWSGGKMGFQFLPDPAKADAEDYGWEAYELDELLGEGTNYNPLTVLVGEDRAFYESLPETFTVYRGCHGVAPEVAGEGLCWTTRREIAEWFAYRSVRGNPVLVSARARKEWVRLALAGEHEVVIKPPRWRTLKPKPRPELWRPKKFGWGG